jgi:hypothetical protein
MAYFSSAQPPAGPSPKLAGKISFAPHIFRGIEKEDYMARNVVQITADPSYLYALCDDGEIFRLVNHAWQPMAPIPQGDLRNPGRLTSAIDPIANEQPGG